MSNLTCKRLLQNSVAATCLLLVLGTSLSAAPAPVPFGIGQSTMLKHLPAGHDELVFRGETARRSFSVYLSRDEVEQTRVFQLGMKNTVALLPERSSLKLIVNGHPLATVPIQSPNALSTVPVTIPGGMLVAGLNKLEVEVTMTHRVDCSVAATYELWTLLDAVQTGFVVPVFAGAPIHSVEEIASEALGTDGATHIVLRIPDAPDAAAIGRAGRFINALVRRAGIARPLIETAPGLGSGPGIDVVLTTDQAGDDATAGLKVAGREDGVTFARDLATGRLVLIMSGLDGTELDAQISTFASKAGSPGPHADGQASIDGEIRLSFADMGLRTDDFTGRHYTASLGLSLPADFYPANYDKARLLVDSDYAANLEPDSGLVFRVNGTLVSALRLEPDRGGVFRHEAIELPLRFFHPGHNEIAIEGVMTTAADRQCATAGAPPSVRFSLADSSELEFPAFAHLGTSPQIPGALAGSRTSPNPVHLYLPQADALSIGSGLTVLANMAVDRPGAMTPVIHFGSPANTDAPGIVVASWASIPAMLSGPLRSRLAVAGTTEEPARSDGDGKAAAPALAPPPARSKPFGFLLQGDVHLPALFDGAARLLRKQNLVDPQMLLGEVARALKAQGYFFATDATTRTVPFTARTLLVAAVDPRLRDHKVAGIEVPRMVDDPAQWLVVTASEEAVLRGGLDRMVSDGHWQELQGDAVSLDVDKGALTSAQPSRMIYVKPERLVLSDLRPILGGLVSNNIELSLALLALLMALLGVSTHAIIRRTGAK